MAKLDRLYAHEILDSRATPTIEVVAILDSGDYGVSSVPSGSSTGSHEAHELRDNDPNRYLGRGVLNAVAHVNGDIAGVLVGKNIDSIAQVDQQLLTLDGTIDKSHFGANTLLGVSMAVTKALAAAAKVPLYRYVAHLATNTQPLFIPAPLFNMINGGKHGAGNLDFQEFIVIPNPHQPFTISLETGAVIYQNIKKILSRRGAIHSVGDEGGFAPNLFTNLDALEVLQEGIAESNRKPGIDVELGLDIAANSFLKDGRYVIKDRSSPMDTAEFIDYLRDLNNQYHLRLLEDALSEDDWRGWAALTAELGSVTTIAGDDLLVTNPEKVKKAIAEKACTAAVIKLNEAGTVTENIAVINQVRSAGWKIIISHRSGETNDTFIADFAVGVGADYAKFGAPARGERVAKYNRFLSIETELTQSPK
ncbi:phosphopyruvate hydratase [Candidatus Amesbacteria bacterium RIFCSPHIGHO2_01_FULL_48_32]|uniref:Enolase n=1 Tax=Candidatus Amesbacteria bacterium RIFCSPLOWO2_01_FULL_48_25 TaxID=1797259 RepID=A0A1F4ZDY2_9BACT|nr:MAG: phosphopyruvate hydratase [Candidatus Amesbacteria bacterium RIFCSPHIGHO2_01_FULL_48_32]OGD03897.1 MAG: phosphopyruvate hydratase [Candidatus Amesbacteria bacterium RIFCSPLOWO2_01_FULL_48_25]HJZ05878.1 phosphopyruvate hydratase [Patescibacteria group bacterium]